DQHVLFEIYTTQYSLAESFEEYASVSASSVPKYVLELTSAVSPAGTCPSGAQQGMWRTALASLPLSFKMSIASSGKKVLQAVAGQTSR
nr:hypothetical protein [Candidatus Dormibacteraeota bacterium]